MVTASLVAALGACATPSPEGAPADRELAFKCSRISPTMQTAVLQAVVHAGGPLAVDVAGWMCGRSPHGVIVRIVLLDFVAEVEPDGGRRYSSREPVIFEDGRMVGFGWYLIEADPDRYGGPLPRRDAEWTTPPGWIIVR